MSEREETPSPLHARQRPGEDTDAARLIDQMVPPQLRGVLALAILWLDDEGGVVQPIMIDDVGDEVLQDALPAGLVTFAAMVGAADGRIVLARVRPGLPFLTAADRAWRTYAETLFGELLTEVLLVTPDLVRRVAAPERRTA